MDIDKVRSAVPGWSELLAVSGLVRDRQRQDLMAADTKVVLTAVAWAPCSGDAPVRPAHRLGTVALTLLMLVLVLDRDRRPMARFQS